MIDMHDYMNGMLEDFPIKFKPSDTVSTTATNDLFAEGESEALSLKEKEEFHMFVAKALFMCNRAHPDIHTTIAVLRTQVKNPNKDDWNKLL